MTTSAGIALILWLPLDAIHRCRSVPRRAVRSRCCCALAHAVISGRDYVIPEDVKAVAPSVLAHRITIKPELWLTRASGTTVTDDVLASVPTPTPGGTISS